MSQLWTLINNCFVIGQTNKVEQKQYFFNKLHFTLKLANFFFLSAHSKSVVCKDLSVFLGSRLDFIFTQLIRQYIIYYFQKTGF